MDDLSGIQRDLLMVLADCKWLLGQTLKAELDEYYRSPINDPQIYTNLDMLVDEGLVEKGDRDGRTNYYTLTAAGDEALRERRQWERQYGLLIHLGSRTPGESCRLLIHIISASLVVIAAGRSSVDP